jgi:hypothetical protein
MELAGAADIEEGPGFLAQLVEAGRGSNMLSLALIPGRSTAGSAAAQALKSIMLHSIGGEEKWLLDEISNFNVPAKRRYFSKEASKALRETLDETLSLALYLHKSSPLAFNSFSIFVLYLFNTPTPSPPGRLLGLLRGGGPQQVVSTAETGRHSHLPPRDP